MATWDTVDVSHLDRDEIEDLHADWDDAFTSNEILNNFKISIVLHIV